MHPVVSLVIPFYQVEDFMGPCLESIRRQTFTDFEVLCIDDGSKDGTREIAERFAAEDPRFKVVVQDNAGLGAARNAGTRLARGKYLMFVDSDDLLAPRALHQLVTTLEETGSDFATGNVWRLSLPRGLETSWAHRIPFAETRHRTSIRELPLLMRDRTAWNKLYRRSFWDEHGFEFPEIMFEDYPVTLKAHLVAEAVDVVSDLIYVWRERPSGNSISQQANAVKNSRDRLDAALMVLDTVDSLGTDELRELVYSHLIDADLRELLLGAKRVQDLDKKAAILGFARALSGRLDPELTGLAAPHLARIHRQLRDNDMAAVSTAIAALPSGRPTFVPEPETRLSRIRPGKPATMLRDARRILGNKKASQLERLSELEAELVSVDTDERRVTFTASLPTVLGARGDALVASAPKALRVELGWLRPPVIADVGTRSTRLTFTFNTADLANLPVGRHALTISYGRNPLKVRIPVTAATELPLARRAGRWVRFVTDEQGAVHFEQTTRAEFLTGVHFDGPRLRLQCSASSGEVSVLLPFPDEPVTAPVVDGIAEFDLGDLLRRDPADDPVSWSAERSLVWSGQGEQLPLFNQLEPVHTHVAGHRVEVGATDGAARLRHRPAEEPWTGPRPQAESAPDPALAPKFAGPLLSVIVPFYNVEPYIEECLESLRTQTLSDIEVICIDDGSLDNTLRTAEAYAARDGRFRVVRQQNMGLGEARNTGVRHASGKYITFIDSDDIVPPRALSQLVGSLERTGSDLSAGNAWRFTKEKGAYQSWTHRIPFAKARPGTHILEFPALVKDRMVWNKVYRRSFWDKFQFAFPPIRYEDYPVTLKAHLVASAVDVLSQHVYLWRDRESGDSITQQKVNLDNVHDRYTSAMMVLEVLEETAAPVEVRTEVHATFMGIDLVAIAEAAAQATSAADRETLHSMGRALAGRLDRSAGEQTTRLATLIHDAYRRGDLDLVHKLASWRLTGETRRLFQQLVQRPEPSRLARIAMAVKPRKRITMPWQARKLRSQLVSAEANAAGGWDLTVTSKLRGQFAARVLVGARISNGDKNLHLPVERVASSASGLSLRISVSGKDLLGLGHDWRLLKLCIDLSLGVLRWSGTVRFDTEQLPTPVEGRYGDWYQWRGVGWDLGLERHVAPVLVECETATDETLRLSVARASGQELFLRRPRPTPDLEFPIEDGSLTIHPAELLADDPADNPIALSAERAFVSDRHEPNAAAVLLLGEPRSVRLGGTTVTVKRGMQGGAAVQITAQEAEAGA